MSTIRAPRWCENGNSCIYSNCPHRHERCKHFDCGRCRVNNMAKPADGGCMYDHRDASTLVEFVRNVRLFNYSDIMDAFGERGLIELESAEQFSPAKMTIADRKLLVRSLKDGGFSFNVLEQKNDEGETIDRIIDIFQIPGVHEFSSVYGPNPKPVEPTEEEIRIGMMTSVERREYIALLSGVPVNCGM